MMVIKPDLKVNSINSIKRPSFELYELIWSTWEIKKNKIYYKPF